MKGRVDPVLTLGLTGMAEALEEQRDIADIERLGFDDRLAMMLEREAEHRDHKSYLGHLRQAQLRILADIQDVGCRAGSECGNGRSARSRTSMARSPISGLRPF